MQITEDDWINYKNKMAALSDHAAENLEAWLQVKGGYQNVSRDQLIQYMYALSTKYGEATASLAAEMYDEVAAMSGVAVPSAEVAETASYGEIASAVKAVTKNITTDSNLGNVVVRYVKRAAEDTTLKNVTRDKKKGAQFAWVPAGDTCAFCLMLASNGWQNQSEKAMRNGHASHIHPNCDCTYAVRFDGKSNVKGYNPDKYKAMYQNAEGKTWNDKLNSIRRIQYQENKDRINAQKRENYYEKRLAVLQKYGNMKVAEQSRKKPGNITSTIISPIIETQEYANKMNLLNENERLTAIMLDEARTSLYHRNGTLKEDLVYIDPTTMEVRSQRNYNVDQECKPTEKMMQMVTDRPGTIIALHNHPDSMLPSYKDLNNAKNYKYGVILCHNGDIIKYTVSKQSNIEFADMILNDMQRDFSDLEKRKEYIDTLKDVGVFLEVI